MIFVTVGTHEQQFNRLVEYMDKWAIKNDEEVVIQIGYALYKLETIKNSGVRFPVDMRHGEEDYYFNTALIPYITNVKFSSKCMYKHYRRLNQSTSAKYYDDRIDTMMLNGRPMCDYLFETISEVDTIDEKYIYCSDEAIKPYISPYESKGLKFLKRDPYLDGFQVKGLEIIDRFIKDVDADIYVLTHVTQPFTKGTSIAKALEKVVSGEYDSAFSAVMLQDYMWMNGKPFNYDMKNIVRTQDLKPIYMETGAFFIFRKEVFTKLGQRIGNKPYIYEIDQFEAVDVDTAEDFEFAKAVAAYLADKGDSQK